MLFASKPPHVRQVMILACTAVALTMIAVMAAIFTREPAKRAFNPEPYFPNLAQEVGELRRIHIEDKDHTTVLTFAPETGWVVTEKDGYRARYDKIQAFVLALADLERFEKRTTDAKWHERLLLTDPRQKDGEATLIQLLDGAGEPIAELLVGANADVDAASGREQVFVRKPGENEVWLARASGLTPLATDSGDWLDTTIIDVPKERIARVEVAPEGAAPYAVVRESPEAENFTLENMPAGMALKSETSANGIGMVLSDLGMRDVAGADRLTFSPASTAATYETFNGLKLRIETAKLGEDVWVRIIPSTSDQADDQARAEAADFARRLAPWVFQIDGWKGAQLGTKLDSLIGPAGESSSSSGPHGGNATPRLPEADASNSEMMVPGPSRANTQKPGAASSGAKALDNAPGGAKTAPSPIHDEDKKVSPHSDNASPPTP